MTVIPNGYQKAPAEVLAKQQAFFQSGASRELAFRMQELQKLERAIDKRENEILRALELDLGKCRQEAYMTEVGLLRAELAYIMKHLPVWVQAQKVRTPWLYPGAKSLIYPEPLGQVLIISPWNYPVYLALTPLLGAMAAGNCAVIKPSELAPHSSSLLQALIQDTFPEEYIALFEGGAEISSELLEQPFDHIFFTGGSVVGRLVMQAAVRRLTPVTLELGGKSPCLVDQDVNIEYTARRIVWGKFLNAGQTCVAPDYLLLQREIKEPLLRKMGEVLLKFYGANPRQSPDYARIISEGHFQRLEALLADGRILYGGEAVREERYIAPTIMDEIEPGSPLLQEEIFGPLLPVLEFGNLEEAIEFVNERPKPLALYFFSHNRKRQEQVLRHSSSGGVCINDTLSHISSPYLPFGGVGESGMGSYHGRASFELFSHKKSILKQSLSFDIPLKYPPYRIPLQALKKLLKILQA
ncbi:MAG: aldehyde dehydrogenase [Syntrophomonas sp.]|nr:aldehyde dehydrogenase [Syntrophomonas sp.]